MRIYNFDVIQTNEIEKTPGGLNGFEEYVVERGADVSTRLGKVNRTILKTMLALHPVVNFAVTLIAQNNPENEQPLSDVLESYIPNLLKGNFVKCAEILGVDVKNLDKALLASMKEHQKSAKFYFEGILKDEFKNKNKK